MTRRPAGGESTGLDNYSQRQNWDSLSEERRQRLSQLPGWAVSARAAWWEEGFRRLEEYVRKNGHACPPQSYSGADSYRLGSWVATQRQTNAKGTLAPDLRARLQKLTGWEWTPNDTRWEDSFRRLQGYVKENRHACPPQAYEDADGYRLGTWVSLQRQLGAKGTLSLDLRDRLQKLPGWQWTPRAALWRRDSAIFRSTSGRTDMPSRLKAMWITMATSWVPGSASKGRKTPKGCSVLTDVNGCPSFLVGSGHHPVALRHGGINPYQAQYLPSSHLTTVRFVSAPMVEHGRTGRCRRVPLVEVRRPCSCRPSDGLCRIPWRVR